MSATAISGNGIKWRVERATALIGAPGLLLLFLLFILPIAYMFWRSVSDPHMGFAHYAEFFSSATYVRVGIRTLWTSLLCVLGCVIIGTPVAYGLAHFSMSRILRVSLVVLVGCFLMSSLVRAFAWMVLLGAHGPVIGILQLVQIPITTLLATPQGVLIGMVHYLLPIYILTAFAGLRSVRFELILAAEGMGATHGYALRTVYLPLARPALMNASSLAFVTAIGFFITPALLGGPGDTMLAQLIALSVNRFGEFGFAAAAGFILLASTLICLSIAWRLLRPATTRA